MLNTYQSLLSFPINFLVSSSSIRIVGGVSDVGPYCADAIRRSVDGFNVNTCINKYDYYFYILFYEIKELLWLIHTCPLEDCDSICRALLLKQGQLSLSLMYRK